MQEQGFAKSWGCDIAQPGATSRSSDPEGELVKVDPCFDFATEGDLLRKKRIPWSYYAATNTQLGYIWSRLLGDRSVPQRPGALGRYIRPVDDIVRDIEADRLPAVTWITPRFELSEHPEYNFCHGENWTTEVMNAIMEIPDVEGHGDLRHVGRFRRLLRPRRPRTRGPVRATGSGCRR